MSLRPYLHGTLLACCAVLLVACGGSSAPAVTDTLESIPQESQVVVRYDLNGDSLPDMLTLDTTQEPFRIIEALEGTADGGARDLTNIMRDHAIDASVSQALANYLAQSLEAGRETELDVADVAGREFTVTIFE